MLVTLTREDFLPHVGTTFEVVGAPVPAELTLLAARDLGPRPERLVRPGTRASAFSLRFRGPSSVLLPQQIWPLRHAALGDLRIFLVPIGREDDGFIYEAIFN